MTGLLHDIRYALRQLRRSPWFTATAILMLALGICATSTALSWIEGTMLRPVPGARDTGRLVSIMRGTWNISPAPPFSYPDYRDLRDANRTFSGILGYHHEWATLTAGETPQRIYAAQVTGNYFDVLGIKPLLGRFFRPDEEARLGGVPYIVLGYSLWKTRFAGDPAILGKSVEIQHQPFTIIGVAPKGFIGCMPAIREDLWVPLAPGTAPGSNDWRILHREDAWLNVIGRLRPGVSRGAATQDLEDDHAPARRRISGRPSRRQHHHPRPHVALALWRQWLLRRLPAGSAGLCGAGAAAHLRQRRHPHAGPLCGARAGPRHPPIAGRRPRRPDAPDDH